MAALVSWEYYSSHYSTIGTQADFEKAEALAEKDLARVIGPLRWAELVISDWSTEFYADQLMDTICKVVNDQATAGKKTGAGVASVSNDGYSESYALAKQSDAQEELQKNIRAWLSGTGLVRAY